MRNPKLQIAFLVAFGAAALAAGGWAVWRLAQLAADSSGGEAAAAEAALGLAGLAWTIGALLYAAELNHVLKRRKP